MPRKGKEPAGLRRWRLAHKKKKRHYSKVVRVARKRRYYGRKKKGGRKQKAFPILLAAPVIPGFVSAYNVRASGPVEMVKSGVYEITGVDITGQSNLNTTKTFKSLGLVVIGIVGHKIATRVGINRIMKKATLGYLQL